MANYQAPYQLGGQFNPALSQMFPQPQGSVYSINSPLDIGNVPIGSTGLSVALCFQEGLMYIKSFQNGSPVIMTYKILPHTQEQKNTNTAPVTPVRTVTTDLPQEVTNKLKLIDELQERITKLENNTKQGGRFDELL